MNNTYYENTDENFVNALKFCQTNYTHEQIVEMLKNGNLVQKQIAALKLETIKSSQDAQIFLSNLTGQDGKIREAVSLRLAEFMNDTNLTIYFEPAKNAQIFLDAVIDINGNICRNVIKAISGLKNDISFCETFCSKLESLTIELIETVEKFDFQDGKYKVNKEAFKLYWCLETIYIFWDKINFDSLKKILIKGASIGEYTIREKVAKILTHNFNDEDLLKIKLQLKNDPNYYVRRF